MGCGQVTIAPITGGLMEGRSLLMSDTISRNTDLIPAHKAYFIYFYHCTAERLI